MQSATTARSSTPAGAYYPSSSGASTSSAGSGSRREGRDREGRARSGSSASYNTVETTVTRLLVAIKQLLESLTLWSQQRATETQVSDVYVRLGNDFNAAVAAFATCGIDMSELLSVPQDLRHVLELCLAEDASTPSLERYLPTVRTIITGLLNGLRQKQSDYRRIQAMRPSRGSGSGSARGERSSRASGEESGSGSGRPRASRQGSGSGRREADRASSAMSSAPSDRYASGGFVPQRSSRATVTDDESLPPTSAAPRSDSRASARTSSRSVPPPINSGGDYSRPSSSLAPPSQQPQQQSPLTGLGISSIPEEDPPLPSPISAQPPSPPAREVDLPVHPPPLTPSAVPPEAKRYSLFDKPMTPGRESFAVPSPPPPPAEQRPLGPERTPSEESTASVTPRPPPPPDVVVHSSSPGTPPPPPPPPPPQPVQAAEPVSPLSPTSPPPSASSALGAQTTLAALQRSDVLERRASKRFSTFNFMRMGASGPSAREKQSLGGVGSRKSFLGPEGLGSVLEGGDEGEKEDMVQVEKEVPPLPPLPAYVGGSPQKPGMNGLPKATSLPSDLSSGAPSPSSALPRPLPSHTPSQSQSPSPTPSPSSPISIFLSLGMQTKKATLEPHGLSFASLRVLFMDRFAYNPGLENFPAIYIEDPGSRVRYELESLEEVREGSRLLLNVEPLDQVKQHIDLQISAVSQDIRELKMAMAASRRMSLGPAAAVALAAAPPPSAPPGPRPSDVQFHAAASKLSRMKTSPDQLHAPPALQLQPQSTGGTVAGQEVSRIFHDLQTQFDEVQNVRRDLGVMRQLYVDFITQTKEALGQLRVQTAGVRELADTKVGGTRAYIDAGKDKLDARSQTALTQIEELTDSVESLKADVVRRQVLPKPTVMRQLRADIEGCAGELESLSQHVATIKPMWKKTWGEELENIVEEQKFLTHQEELLADLIEDHKALREVFGHVEKFISLKGGASGPQGSGGSQKGLRAFRPPPPDESGGGGGSLNHVLMEIRGAAVDPERRLRAIAAAQKQRDRELASRSDEFQAELSGFVEGKKLKLTGGPEEVERLRQKRNEQNLRAMFGVAQAGSSGSLVDQASPISPSSPASSSSLK